jgi:hypothetical protein
VKGSETFVRGRSPIREISCAKADAPGASSLIPKPFYEALIAIHLCLLTRPCRALSRVACARQGSSEVP